MQIIVYCADVGSVVNGNFGWARGNPAEEDTIDSGVDIEEFAERLAIDLNSGFHVAVGFECPLFVPLRRHPNDLTKKRDNEGNRPWSAGAGSGSLAVGLVQLPWILTEVKQRLLSSVMAYLDWKPFPKRDADLLLWEAFVSGGARGVDPSAAHAEDAAAAVRRFIECINDLNKRNIITENNVYALAGAALLRTGWSTDIELLTKPCLVLKAEKG